MNEWLDRILAGLGGGLATLAAIHFSTGHPVRAAVELGLTGLCAWLCAPVRPRRLGLGEILSETERERIRAQLDDVYGMPNGLPDTYRFGGAASWDMFGTPVIWCRSQDVHAAHLWPINGPQYAPALCMGHDCPDPKTHLPESWKAAS